MARFLDEADMVDSVADMISGYSLVSSGRQEQLLNRPPAEAQYFQ